LPLPRGLRTAPQRKKRKKGKEEKRKKKKERKRFPPPACGLRVGIFARPGKETRGGGGKE